MDLMHGEVIEIDDDTEVSGGKIDDEMKHYLAENIMVPRGTSFDPLKWWKMNAHRFSALSVLAKKLLAVPGTSVPSERVFSVAGSTVTKKRASLSSATVDKLLFLN